MNAMAEPRTGIFNAPNWEDDGRHCLAFLDWGDIDNEKVIVCVHGLTRNAHDFDYLARELSQTHRVIAIDMPGRGDSDAIADSSQYNYVNYLQDCIALMDNFHFRKVDWIGTSMGGIIGMMIAAFHPARIKKLVLNDIGAFIPRAALKRIVDYVDATPASFTSRSDVESHVQRVLASFGITDPEHWQHFYRYSIKERADGSFALAYDPHILDPVRNETQNFSNIQDIDLSMIWEAVQTPTLILRGELSDVLERETASAMRSKHLKCNVEEIKGVGHAPTLMEPEQIALITRWLASAPVAAQPAKRA